MTWVGRTAAEIAAAVREGEVSAGAVIEEHLTALAGVALDPDRARLSPVDNPAQRLHADAMVAPQGGDPMAATLGDTALAPGAWTVEDLDDLPEHRFRHVEIDSGVLIVSPPPSVPHNGAALELAVLLKAACPPDLKVGMGDGVKFRGSYRQPDVDVYRRERFRERFLTGGADVVLVVEVVSPSSIRIDRRDRRDKVEDYASIGVPHYWIVELDPEPMLVVFRLRGAAYEEIARVHGDDVYTATEPFPVSITPSELLG